jgi:hypothetical protein
MLRGTYDVNQTYPCWAATHGATHVYLDIHAPAQRMFWVDTSLAVLVGSILLVGSFLVCRLPSVEPHARRCLGRLSVAMRAMETAWEASDPPAAGAPASHSQWQNGKAANGHQWYQPAASGAAALV